MAMTPKALRTLAVSWPETAEVPHFERTSFRVNGKIFATMTADGTEAMVRVKPRERLYQLLKAQPDVFFSYGGFTERNGALGVRLLQIDAKLLRKLLLAAYRTVAPKRALARLDGVDRRNDDGSDA